WASAAAQRTQSPVALPGSENDSMYCDRQGENRRCDRGASRLRLLFNLHLRVFGDNLLRYFARHLFIMIKLLAVDASPLRHGAQVRGITEELFQRTESADDLMRSVRIHPENLSPPAGDVAHDVSHVLVRDYHFNFVNRLEEDRARLLEPFLERHSSGDL